MPRVLEVDMDVKGLDAPLRVSPGFLGSRVKLVVADRAGKQVQMDLDGHQSWWALRKWGNHYSLDRRLPAPRDAADDAIGGAAQAPLNSKQRQVLAVQARKAYARAGAETGLSFDDWRHEQCEAAAGIPGLTCARQRHYKALKGHFDKLAGKPARAFRNFLGDSNGSQDRELALAKLSHTADACKDVLPDGIRYAEGMLAKRGVAGIADASAKQIWHCVFMLRKRAGKLRKDDMQKGGGR